MISQSDCIQFFVKSDDKFFILHEDEIDITGMYQDQIHCSSILSKFVKAYFILIQLLTLSYQSGNWPF